MQKYLINVPVALIFFARPDVLKETFAAIRAAKPKQLFLIQDGSRLNHKDDLKKIVQCREIVSNVDWECEVRTNYSDLNLGCGMRVYSGISWAFEYVDRLAIIEDDCVPCVSFFQFCEEVLEKYKSDERINMISGMNHEGISQRITADYLFTESGSIWGWATWKRVWDTVDFNLSCIKNHEIERLINNLHGPFLFKEGRKKLSKLEDGQNLTSWSHQFGINMYIHSRLNIVPKYNLITNIGLTENGANSVTSLKFIPKGLRRVYFMKTHEMQFPLKHPNFVINDIEFRNKVERIMGVGHPFVNFYRTCESVFYRIIAGEFLNIMKGLKRRINNI